MYVYAYLCIFTLNTHRVCVGSRMQRRNICSSIGWRKRPHIAPQRRGRRRRTSLRLHVGISGITKISMALIAPTPVVRTISLRMVNKVPSARRIPGIIYTMVRLRHIPRPKYWSPEGWVPGRRVSNCRY